MKTGLTLEELAAEITRQQNAKEDYVVNTGNLRFESYGSELALHVLDSNGADRIEPLEMLYIVLLGRGQKRQYALSPYKIRITEIMRIGDV